MSDAPSDGLIGDHVGSYWIEHLIGDDCEVRIARQLQNLYVVPVAGSKAVMDHRTRPR